MENYKSKMYNKPVGNILLTGDIVELNYSHFEDLVLHPSMLNVLKQFEQDKPKKPSLWVILNKPCDMVFEPDSRSFNNNLILCPLQGLKDNIKNGGFLSRIRSAPSQSPSINSLVQEFMSKQIKLRLKQENPKPEDVEFKEYEISMSKATSSATNALMEKVKEITETTATPQEWMTALINLGSENSDWLGLFREFQNSKEWKKYIELVDKAKKDEQKITVKDDQVFSQLCNNQLDTQGVFFFEPHESLLKFNYDACFVLELEDLLTIKIKPEKQKSGEINAVLVKQRILSLEPSFSARLQNFITVFMGKVGTDDILSAEIIKFYQSHYSFGEDIYFPEVKTKK